MNCKALSLSFLLAGSMALSAAQPGQQTIGGDLKDAGKKTTGAVKTGARKTKHGVVKGTHKTAAATAKGADAVKNKTTGTSN